MWILPKQLHTSAFVPDTEALISDLNEQSQVCAQSLLARSKPSPARTWSQRWKRDSWTQHLSGRILKPSHGPSFVTAWTSSLAATRASHSAQPASDSAPKTPDTSGRLSQPELLQCDQVPAFLKTSTDISRWGFPTCCKTWQDWVTERRGAWRQRVNAARLTRGKGSSFWPTVTANEDSYRIGGESQQSKCLSAMARRGEMDENWPTPDAHQFGSALGANQKSPATITHAVKFWDKHGQAAQASSSSHGSRQGLSVDWRTPQAQEAGAKVETLFTKDGAPAMPGQRAYRKTPSGKLVLQSQTINQQVEMVQNWATPRSGKTTDENPETWALRQAKGDVATMPLTAQVKAWATPIQGDSHLASTPEVARKRIEEGKVTLSRQKPGKLNPRWVETLMGLPIGWTMPSCIRPVTIAQTSCDSSGTALCQPSQSERSDFFLAS
jgi:hypothetical protein